MTFPGVPTLKLLVIAGLAILIVGTGGYVWGRIDCASLREAAVARALQEAQAATDRAMKELSNDAEKARFERRLCIERGGVWSFADNDCATD